MMERLRSKRWVLYIGVISVLISTIVLLGPDVINGRWIGNDSIEANATVDPGSIREKVRLVLDGTPSSRHAFIFAADNRGYFHERGLDLEVIIPNLTDNAMRMVGSGHADLALVHQPQVLLARNNQTPVVSIAAVIRRPLAYLMVPKSSPIHSPSNLAGKKVGYSQLPLYESIVNTMVEDDDGDPSSVEFVNIAREYTTSLQDGGIDALIGPTIVHDRLSLENKGISVRIVEPMLYGVPSYYDTVLTANELAVKEKPELFSKIWEALTEGQEYVAEHPEEALRMVLRRQSQQAPLDPEVEAESLKLLLPFMDAGEEPFGYQSGKAWSDVSDWLSDLEIIDSSVDSERAYVNLSIQSEIQQEE